MGCCCSGPILQRGLPHTLQKRGKSSPCETHRLLPSSHCVCLQCMEVRLKLKGQEGTPPHSVIALFPACPDHVGEAGVTGFLGAKLCSVTPLSLALESFSNAG